MAQVPGPVPTWETGRRLRLLDLDQCLLCSFEESSWGMKEVSLSSLSLFLYFLLYASICHSPSSFQINKYVLKHVCTCTNTHRNSEVIPNIQFAKLKVMVKNELTSLRVAKIPV